MVTGKVNKGMKMIMLLCVSALMACQSKGGQNDDKVPPRLDTYEEVADTIDYDYAACHISQLSLDREIYIGTVGSNDDEVPVVIHSIKNDNRDTIMAEINARPISLLEGRTRNEVLIFSIGGNGACGWLTKVDIEKKRCMHVELGLGVSDIKKTKGGFFISRFSKPSWNEDGVYREWTELWDYEMKMIRSQPPLKE